MPTWVRASWSWTTAALMLLPELSEAKRFCRAPKALPAALVKSWLPGTLVLMKLPLESATEVVLALPL